MIVSYNSVRPSFMMLLSKMPVGKIRGIEIGTAVGKNAVRMLDYCDRLELVSVDIEKAKEIDDIIKLYGTRFDFIHSDSVMAARQFPGIYFDYVYIDGAHDEENVYKDIKAWYPKLRLGGIMGGHDWWLRTVQQGVVKYLNETHWQFLFAVQDFYNIAKRDIESHDAEFMDWWFTKKERR